MSKQSSCPPTEEDLGRTTELLCLCDLAHENLHVSEGVLLGTKPSYEQLYVGEDLAEPPLGAYEHMYDYTQTSLVVN
ncbi:MAG: hypothetical protein ACLPQS_06070 [Acidimicrobiales bacterium]